MTENTLFDLLAQQTQLESDFNGSISAQNAWTLLNNYKNTIKLVDIRTHEERVFTGYIPDSLHVAWATGTAFTRNPRFIKELENKTGKKDILFLFCRSGNRSRLAAIAAKAAGFEHVYQISEGFEGELDHVQQRNHINGWKFHNLPWIQN